MPNIHGSLGSLPSWPSSGVRPGLQRGLWLKAAKASSQGYGHGGVGLHHDAVQGLGSECAVPATFLSGELPLSQARMDMLWLVQLCAARPTLGFEAGGTPLVRIAAGASMPSCHHLIGYDASTTQLCYSVVALPCKQCTATVHAVRPCLFPGLKPLHTPTTSQGAKV